MTFQEAIKSVFSKYAVFSGRARRSEFWFFYLFTCLVDAFIIVLGYILSENFLLVILPLVQLGLFVPSLSVTVRRLHDTNRSGAKLLLLFIPVIGWIILFFDSIRATQPEKNSYGPSPKTEE